MRDIQAEILDFWFVQSSPAQWFQKNADFDAIVKNQFEPAYNLAVQGMFDHWRDTPDGCLAYILLLDQFPRNMFRGAPEAFATDRRALDMAQSALEKSFDKLLPLEQRRFIYLPFEHDETMESQEKSVRLFEKMKSSDPIAYDYAVRHKEVIEQFGRFPHRNAALNRQNTAQENEYLKNNIGF